MPPTDWKLIVFSSGWAYVHIPEAGPPFHVRLRPEPSGRIVVERVHVAVSDGVTSEHLRAIPLARVEAAANAPEVQEHLRTRFFRELQTLWDADKHYWEAMTDAAHSPLGEPSQPDDAGGFDVFAAARQHSLRLDVPSERRKPDSFYRAVADAYAHAASLERRPAVMLAEANDVPVTTVHRWVKEARRRGLMTQGQRTKEGDVGAIAQTVDEIQEGPLGAALDDLAGRQPDTDESTQGDGS